MAGEIDTSYVKSAFGILKILEFICLVIGWACMIDYFGGVRGLHSRNSFFLGVNISAWVFVIVWFIGYLFMLCNQIKLFNKMLIYGFVHLSWFVLLLISGALVADWAANLNSQWCRYLNVRCEIYECAAAFGLISAFLFLIDGILHIKQRNIVSVGGTSTSSGGGRVVTKRTVVKTTTTKTKR